MVWPVPEYSRKQVTKAGNILIESRDFDIDEWLWAFEVLTNWRACHGYPINTFQATLRKKLQRIDSDALVAQRLKRTPSIIKKLERIKGMSLARMQDIGGLRAVVGTLAQVRQLQEDYKKSRFTHSLVSEHDYIAAPKISGYRSIHLVYRYESKEAPQYNGLQVELQVRTRLQHAWATAVETTGTLINHSLKSSEGPEVWLKFFELVGSAFAYLENSPRVPGYDQLTREETFERTWSEAKRLGVRDKLKAYSNAVNAILQGLHRAAYYLVVLDLSQKTVRVTPFSRDQLEEANKQYSVFEKQVSDGEPLQVVLVAAGSVDSLKRAYPNYFLDTHEFLLHLRRIERAAAIKKAVKGVEPTR